MAPATDQRARAKEFAVIERRAQALADDLAARGPLPLAEANARLLPIRQALGAWAAKHRVALVRRRARAQVLGGRITPEDAEKGIIFYKSEEQPKKCPAQMNIDGLHCVLTSSSTSSSGDLFCDYMCQDEPKPPTTPPEGSDTGARS